MLITLELQNKFCLSAAQRKFAHSLRDFKFEFIGDAETDDERCIDASLREFSNFLKNLEEQREIMEEKKKFDKETEKNYSLIDKHLTLSARKKDSHLQEADLQVEQTRQHFYELSLEYVCKLQEIQERKKFEFVEPMLSFFQGMFTFYHQGHELSKDFNHYKMELQINIQNTRNRFEGTRSEVEELMNKIRQNPKDHKRASQFTVEGYLYVQEKRPAPFGSSWVKHYCMYRKTAKKFSMIPFEHRSGGKLGDGEVFFLKECTRRHTDSIDRRFCFDIEAADRPGIPLTVQAFSEEERKQWLEALGGKEALFHTFNRAIIPRPEGGINDQGLYRVVGVSSKVQRLLSMLMDAKTCNELDLENSVDWEVKTVTSALKQYLRSLPEPLMTYELHRDFIVPASDSPSPVKEDTPTSSQDSLSTPSPTTSSAHGPSGPDGNPLAADGGRCGDCTATTVINRKARAVYPCEAEHSSELSFEIGAIFEDVQTSREPGWLEGTLNGKRGLIPQNYVKLL
ncbi:Arhgap10 [Phodopus roborovskii]|uniref:Arhgap10 protein n=1 Tax=Phodopus roborovskii TaxID=109678 RepID=A0AAV0A7F3_PHORO|nr:Arhgap10 [Phodopus roborovskii]